MTSAGAMHPEICSDSETWQSESWTRSVDTVYRRPARLRLLNNPVLIALRLFFQRHRYRVILTTGNATTLYYGLLCRLLFLDQKQVVAQLYLDERRGLAKLLHDPLMRFVLRGTLGVIVTSRGELPLVEERFGVPPQRMRFVAFHTNVIEPERSAGGGGFVFAGGRNYRDYETLLRAVDGLDTPVTIVCGEQQLQGRELPANVTVRRELPWDEYIALVRASEFVVVPLANDNVPAGQVAILEALAYGRPVVTARNVGTVDYVLHGQNGFLYEPGDAKQLGAQIARLAGDAELRERLGSAAYDSVISNYTWERHVAAKIGALRDLAGLSARG